MAKYLVLYRASKSAQEQMASGTPEQAKEGMELWMQWAGTAGSAIGGLLGQAARGRAWAVGTWS